jgi:hypothetical protein
LGGRGRRISDFETSLVYKVSSRTAKALQRNPVSKTKQKQKQTNKQTNKKPIPKPNQTKKKKKKKNQKYQVVVVVRNCFGEFKRKKKR